MKPQVFLDGRVTLYIGDCLKVLPRLPADSVDAVVVDAPYHLGSIQKRFGKAGAAPAKFGRDGAYQRQSAGFMGKKWDGGDIAFRKATWRRVLRVLKPGGYIIAFGSSRTYGRMAVAIEDAGFITHPMIGWIFGQGFPKAHNAAKAIDRELGAAGSITPAGDPVKRMIPGADQNKVGWEKNDGREYQPGSYLPATAEAERWLGWAYGGQTTKPALEPIYMGQKPFSERNGAANILKHGVGAINIDATRVPISQDGARSNPEDNTACTCHGHEAFQSGHTSDTRSPVLPLEPPDGSGSLQPSDALRAPILSRVRNSPADYPNGHRLGDEPPHHAQAAGPDAPPSSFDVDKSLDRCAKCGRIRADLSKSCGTIHNVERRSRWPANLIHDGSDEVLAEFPDAPGQQRGVTGDERAHRTVNTYGDFGTTPSGAEPRDDAGSAARFFKAAKFTDGELLLWRAKANISEWNPELANTVDGNSVLSKEVVGSVLNDAVTWASQGTLRSFPVHFTSATPSELRRISEAVTATILNTGSKLSQGLLLDGLSPNASRVSAAAQLGPIVTMRITVSHWKSDGSAEPVIFDCTEISLEPGALGSEPKGFHYTAKADAEDRIGSKHPTVKPLDLMQYLVRLVTPPGGTVLDCFAGTGVTGEAAFREGFKAILVEAEPEYADDIARRMDLADNPTKRSAVAKSKNKLMGAEGTPLFGDV